MIRNKVNDKVRNPHVLLRKLTTVTCLKCGAMVTGLSPKVLNSVSLFQFSLHSEQNLRLLRFRLRRCPPVIAAPPSTVKEAPPVDAFVISIQSIVQPRCPNRTHFAFYSISGLLLVQEREIERVVLA
ncbi:unnamed protein product [Vicia faba]|uniref:Uncharacterized protein n=1 Tax=Vicia faba TaxID=3906 RepID=A0AAV0Z7V6_VICFA|nr:unnamed protein product [Vicia faba]